jgi:hypothetical protein
MSSHRASLGTRVTAALCAALLIPSNVVSPPLPHPQAAATASSAAKIPNDQLDSLVAPIALYPIRSWRRCLPPRRTLSKSSNCNSG